MSAPISDNTTAPPPAEPVLATTAPSEPVKPVESTEATTTATTTTTTTTTTETPAAPELEVKKTESPELETKETNAVLVEKPVETAPVETEASHTPAATAAAATTEEPPKATQEVVVPPTVADAATIVTAAAPPPVVSSGPSWPELSQAHPLAKFQSRLGEILEAAEHNLIWGIKLSAEEPIPFHTTLVLQKFLRANSNNVDAAYNQLLQTLKWRKEFKPEAAVEEEFSEARFGGLGYVTKINTNDGEKIITYNIYGACKDPKKTFGELDSFLRWRIALMEMGVMALELQNATVPIPDFDATSPGSAIDPYQLIQLHDYQNVSFLRMDSSTKAASKKAIEVMASYYPELLSVKYFVNVPFVMSWVFTAMKAILSKETVRKFRVLSSGKGVASDLGDDVPKAYGGKGRDLADAGLTPKLLNDVPPPVVKEKKPSKKSSMTSLEKMKEKEKVSEPVPPAYSPVEAPESSTAPAPNVAPIPEVKEEEAAAEKASANVPDSSSTAPIPPTKDESSSPAEAATPHATVEGSTTVDEPVGSVTGGADTEQRTESAPVTVEETKPEKEESTKKDSLPLLPIGATETVDVEKKLDESNTTTEESKPTPEAKTLA